MVDFKDVIKDFKVPKSIIKKVFPPKKCVSIKGGNVIEITGINVIQPFSLPKEINIGDRDIKSIDPSQYLDLYLDGEQVNISKEAVNFGEIINSMKLNIKGGSFSVEDILQGKAGGKNVAMGDNFSIDIKMPESFMGKLTPGKHDLKIESESFPNIDLEFNI